MPKTPITSRRSFFETIRADTVNKSKRMLDWNMVDTALGPMAEPRAVLNGAMGPVTNVDAVDAAFDSITEMQAEAFQQATGSGGELIPSDFYM